MRRVQQAGAFAVVVKKGDARAGAVLVKVVDRRADVVRLYAEATRADGEPVWMQPHPGADEAALDAYAQRAKRIDPDLWIIEIEDSQGRHFLTETVEPPRRHEPDGL